MPCLYPTNHDLVCCASFPLPLIADPCPLSVFLPTPHLRLVFGRLAANRLRATGTAIHAPIIDGLSIVNLS